MTFHGHFQQTSDFQLLLGPGVNLIIDLDAKVGVDVCS